LSSKEQMAIARLAQSHDQMAIQMLAVSAVLGAAIEKSQLDPRALAQWCQALSAVSGVPLRRIQARAVGILKRPHFRARTSNGAAGASRTDQRRN
jgi:hypothetical protein